MDADELVTAAHEGNKVPPNAFGILVRLVNLFGILAIAGSAFSLAANQYWIADLAVQFRVQYLIMLLPAIVVWARKRRSNLSIIGGLALAMNLWPIGAAFRCRVFWCGHAKSEASIWRVTNASSYIDTRTATSARSNL